MIQTARVQPDDGMPVDCTALFDGWRIPGVLSSVLSPTQHILAPTFDAFIDEQPEHIAALLPSIHWYF